MKTGDATPAGIDVGGPEFAGEIIVLVRRALVRLDRSIEAAPSVRVRLRLQRIRREIDGELTEWEARSRDVEPTWRDELAEMLEGWEGHMARIDAALASVAGEDRERLIGLKGIAGRTILWLKRLLAEFGDDADDDDDDDDAFSSDGFR